MSANGETDMGHISIGQKLHNNMEFRFYVSHAAGIKMTINDYIRKYYPAMIKYDNILIYIGGGNISVAQDPRGSL